MKVKGLHLQRLRNDEHFQFHTHFRDLINAVGAAVLKVKTLFDTFIANYGLEDEALKRISKSAITADIHDADARRDDLFRGMSDAVTSACNHYDPKVRAAAERVVIVFDTYGNVRVKPLEEETSAIYNLVTELSDKHINDVEMLSIAGWVQALDAANVAFDKLMKNRFDEAASRDGMAMKEARRRVDAAYYDLTRHIEALSIVEGGEVYDNFIARLNAVIDRTAHILAQRVAQAHANEKNKGS